LLCLALAVGRLTGPLGVNVVFALAGAVVVIGAGLAVFTLGFRALLMHNSPIPA